MGSVAAPPLVVKVGGSLAASGRLAETLEIIASASRPVVVVPGGGAFADKVRDLQRALKFDDAAAHRMAMLGMHEMADVITSMNKAFTLAGSLDGIASVISSGKTPVWLPLPMMERDGTVPANWETTSDTLAARLAELLGGAQLVLIKSLDADAAASAATLAADGVVDQGFPAVVGRAGLAWRIFGPEGACEFRALLAGRAPIATIVNPASE